MRSQRDKTAVFYLNFSLFVFAFSTSDMPARKKKKGAPRQSAAAAATVQETVEEPERVPERAQDPEPLRLDVPQ